MEKSYTANLVGSGTASAKSTYSSYAPANAFDGDKTSTFWWSNDGNGQWLQYDFGQPQAIAKYTITNANHLNDSPKQWVLKASNDGTTWEVKHVVRDENWTELWSSKTYEFDNAKAYRYWRFDEIYSQGGSSSWCRWAEVEMFALLAPRFLIQDGDAILTFSMGVGKPLVQPLTGPSAKAVASEEHSSDFAAWKAFDGIVASTFTNAWETKTQKSGWISYEFDTPVVIGAYSMQSVSHSEGPARMPRDFTFDAYDELEDAWVTLDQQVGVSWTTSPQMFFVTNGRAYRKYRINCTANNGGPYLCIAEIQFYRPTVTWTQVGTAPVTQEMFMQGVPSLDGLHTDTLKDLTAPKVLAYIRPEEVPVTVVSGHEPTLVTPTGDLPLRSAQSIRGFAVAGSGNARVLVSSDQGITWYAHGDVARFRAEFSGDLSAQWEATGSGAWTYDPTVDALIAVGGDQATYTHREYRAMDVDLRAVVSEAHDGGIVARFQDHNNHYLLALWGDADSDGSLNLHLYRKVNGNCIDLGSVNTVWSRGTKKQIRWVISGERHEVYFDGALVMTKTDSGFLGPGRIGFRNHAPGGRSVFHSLEDVMQSWTAVDATNLAEVAAKGMTADALTNLPAESWAELIGDADPIRLRFAYYLDRTAQIHSLTAVLDMKGMWQAAIPGLDWRYSNSGERLRVRLLRDGDYKINY